jgi:hypothetical protein
VSKVVTSMTIHDVDHYSEEERQTIIDSYPSHERKARAEGIPQLGSGRIFPIDEDFLKEPAPIIAPEWARIAGIDFGWDHPTATVWIAWDRDADVYHLYDCYRQKEQTPVIHAAAMKPRGTWIPVAWPHDGYQHDKGSGKELRDQYQAQGVNMIYEHALWESGGNGVEAGIQLMLDLMQTGRLKVAEHLHEWFGEFRLYHRKDGKIIKEYDDLMAATRYALMMVRHAKTKPNGKTLEFTSEW